VSGEHGNNEGGVQKTTTKKTTKMRKDEGEAEDDVTLFEVVHVMSLML